MSLARHTPLRRVGFQSRRTSAPAPNLRTSDIPSPVRKSLRPQSKQREADNVRRRAIEALLFSRQPWCANCGKPGALGADLSGHERRGRAQGGDPTKPDCLLCHGCNTWCEDNPIMAAKYGWKLSRKWSRHSWLAANQAWTVSGRIYTFPTLAEADA